MPVFHHKHWSIEELAWLATNFSTLGHQELCTKLGRSWASIKNQAHLNNLRRGKIVTATTWAEEQVVFLRANYSNMPQIELCKALHRKWGAIKGKAGLLKLRRPVYQDFDPPKVRAMSDLERAYVACAIDTEGSLMIKWYKNKQTDVRKYPKAHISIGNSNHAWLEYVQQLIGTGYIYKQKRGKLTKKQCWSYQLYRRPDVHSLLLQIHSFLIIKQDKADRILLHIKDGKYHGTFDEIAFSDVGVRKI